MLTLAKVMEIGFKHKKILSQYTWDIRGGGFRGGFNTVFQHRPRLGLSIREQFRSEIKQQLLPIRAQWVPEVVSQSSLVAQFSISCPHTKLPSVVITPELRSFGEDWVMVKDFGFLSLRRSSRITISWVILNISCPHTNLPSVVITPELRLFGEH